MPTCEEIDKYMTMFLGILTLITALTISAVAIYYSVAGLVAIFAGAALPIIIMGSALEVAKLVTTVWLHRFWNQTSWWLKTYLTTSVVVLMFITSMGIFGFLSRAHIEQTATATEGLAQIERIDEEIQRQQDIIGQSEQRIKDAESSNSTRDQELQAQIDREQSRIDNAYTRVQPAIDEQLKLIESEDKIVQQRVIPLNNQIESINQNLSNLQESLNNNDVRKVQSIVGVAPDGDFGPGTARAVERYRNEQIQRRDDLVKEVDAIKTTPSEISSQARQEISRLRSFAEQQITDSNQLISRLRSQLGQTQTENVQQLINQQLTRIASANQEINNLEERKYQLETDYRKLEAEVGPIKYIAEFIYKDEPDKDLLEEAVRWVILIIIFVFDPLAVLLLIASQHTFKMRRNLKSNLKGEVHDKFIREDNVRIDWIEPKTLSADTEFPSEIRTNLNNSTDIYEPKPDRVGTEIVRRDVAVHNELQPDPVKIAESFQSKKKI